MSKLPAANASTPRSGAGTSSVVKRKRSFEGLGLSSEPVLLRRRLIPEGWRQRSMHTYSRFPKQYQPVLGLVYKFLRRKRPELIRGVDARANAELMTPHVLGLVRGVPVTIELARASSQGDSREFGGRNNYGTFKIGYGKECAFLKISKRSISENLARGLTAVNKALSKAGNVVNGTRVEAIDHILMHDFSFRKDLENPTRSVIVTEFFPEREYEQVGAMQPCPAKTTAISTLQQVKQLVAKEADPWPTPDISRHNAFRSKRDGSLYLYDLSP